MLGGAAAYYFITSDSSTNQSESSNAKNEDITAESLDSLFNYASIRDVTEFDGYTWVSLGSGVVRYNDDTIESYTQTDGLDGPSAGSFVVFNNQLWVATANGVSRYLPEQNKFKAYFADVIDDGFSGGIGNVNLFNNTLGNVLSVSSFKGFYEYDASQDTFVITNGPINTGAVYFNDSEGVAITWEGGATSVLYHYTPSEKWSLSTPLTSYTDQGVYVRKVDNRFVVFGRSKDYQSCESVGTAPATLFDEFASGTLTPIAELNEQFKLNELTPGDDRANYQAKTFGCEGQEEKAYNFVIKSGSIGVEEVTNPIEPWNPEAEQPYLDSIEQLKQRLQREPIFRVLGVEADGSLITMYSDGVVGPIGRGNGTTGAASSSMGYNLVMNRLATVEEGRFGSAKKIGQIDWMDDSTVSTPVLCDGALSYAMFINVSDYDGIISDAKLYDVRNGGLEEVADLKELLVSSEAPRNVYCSETALQWVYNTDVVSFNRESKEITKEKFLDGDRQRFGVALTGNKLWVSIGSYNEEPIGYRDMTTGKFTDIDLKIDKGTQDDPKVNTLIGINESLIWMVLDSNPNGRVVAFNLSGDIVYEHDLSISDGQAYFSGGVLIGKDKMMLQLQGSWSVHEGFAIFDATAKTVKEIKPTIPVRGDIGSLVYNPTTNRVWVNAGDMLFSVIPE